MEQLSPDQRNVMALVLSGKSVFFTGCAGTGKSFLLKHIVGSLKAKFGEEFVRRVAVTATTGIAATHVGGITINSALGVGAPKRLRDFRAMLRADNKARIRGWSVLIVDEISMMSAEFFEEMWNCIQEARRDMQPLQLVICGDFHQLPPIASSAPPATPHVPSSTHRADFFSNAGFAFQSPAWQAARMEHVVLQQVFRQNDDEFLRLLADIRRGDPASALRALRRLVQLCGRPLPEKEGVKPTHIFARNKDVDNTNHDELTKLSAKRLLMLARDDVTVSRAKVIGGGDDASGEGDASARTSAEDALKRNEFFRDCLAGKQVSLCVGAQVMLLKNIDVSKGLVNGSRGVVVGFVPKREIMNVANNQKILASWSGTDVPIVRWMDGSSTHVLPARFSAEVNGLGEVARVQIPLKLAWAITSHKSQGMTLDYVRVSLASIFAPGQAYVVLSRARCLSCLEIVDASASCVRTDPAVTKFYELIGAGGDCPLVDGSAWNSIISRRCAFQSAA